VLNALSEFYPGSLIEKANVYLRDPEIRLGATPDAWMGNHLIEAKVISRPVFDGWNDDPPIYYTLQALTCAMLADATDALLCCLVIDTYSAELVTFHVERNPAAESRIRDGVAQFWENTALGIRPLADYGEDGQIIAKLYRPKDELAPLDLSSDNRLPEILSEREGLRRNISAYEARCDAIRAEVVEKMNGAPAAICGDWKLTHKLIHQPEQIRKATSFPRLTVTRKREATPA
jgi:predicted phage-related endonuclease